MPPEPPSSQPTDSDLPASFPAPSSPRSAASRRSRGEETVPQTILRILKEIVIELLRLASQALEATADRLETGAARRSASPHQRGNVQKARTWWSELLREVRSLLPAPINQKLSNFSLTSILALILVTILWTAFGFVFPKPAPQVATTPVPARIESPTPEIKISEPPNPAPPPPAIVEIPIADPPAELPANPLPESPPSADVALAPEPSPVPELAKPTPMPTPDLLPPLRLTPEQKLIASIQDQVAAVSDRYADGLIRSVQANFRLSRLSVRLGEGWYGLSAAQQDQMANELLKRAQTLDFSKLELLDATDRLLARSPVVGTEMVILQRTIAVVAPA